MAQIRSTFEGAPGAHSALTTETKHAMAAMAQGGAVDTTRALGAHCSLGGWLAARCGAAVAARRWTRRARYVTA